MGTVFVEIIKKSWQQILYWGIGFAIFGWMVVMLIPNVEFLDQMRDLIESMPPFIIAMLGVGDNMEFVATPEGFIALGFFGKMGLFIAAYPVIMGLRITVNDEDQGIMDMVLSLPLPRWRVVLEGFFAYLISVIVGVGMMLAGVWIGTMMSTLDLDLNLIAEAVVALLPGLALIMAITLFLGTILQRRRWVIWAATAVVIGFYMLDTVGSMIQSDLGQTMREFSFFYYYNAPNVMLNGIDWTSMVVLLGIAAVLVAGSVVFYQRRDISV